MPGRGGGRKGRGVGGRREEWWRRREREGQRKAQWLVGYRPRIKVPGFKSLFCNSQADDLGHASLLLYVQNEENTVIYIVLIIK